MNPSPEDTTNAHETINREGLRPGWRRYPEFPDWVYNTEVSQTRGFHVAEYLEKFHRQPR